MNSRNRTFERAYPDFTSANQMSEARENQRGSSVTSRRDIISTLQPSCLCQRTTRLRRRRNFWLAREERRNEDGRLEMNSCRAHHHSDEIKYGHNEQRAAGNFSSFDRSQPFSLRNARCARRNTPQPAVCISCANPALLRTRVRNEVWTYYLDWPTCKMHVVPPYHLFSSPPFFSAVLLRPPLPDNVLARRKSPSRWNRRIVTYSLRSLNRSIDSLGCFHYPAIWPLRRRSNGGSCVRLVEAPGPTCAHTMYASVFVERSRVCVRVSVRRSHVFTPRTEMHVTPPMMSREEDRALALTAERNRPLSLLNYRSVSASIAIWLAKYSSPSNRMFDGAGKREIQTQTNQYGQIRNECDLRTMLKRRVLALDSWKRRLY